MSPAAPPTIALIVIDVQRAFDEWEDAGQRRNNPDALTRIADLLAAFRAKGAPIFRGWLAISVSTPGWSVTRPGPSTGQVPMVTNTPPRISMRRPSRTSTTKLHAA